MASNKVQTFYDAYVQQQVETGINDRIYGVYKRLLTLGLNPRSSVLELGCGVGMMTSLLKRTVTQGKIHAIDLSEGSIRYAKEKFASPHVAFSTQDITEFSSSVLSPDFITLIDVLEHIPLDQHAALLERISNIMGLHSQFVINLPNPEYIAHDIALEADSLQVIDQPVPFANLIHQLDKAHLELMHYEKYGIWHHDEYQWFVLRKKRPFEEKALDDSLTISQKILRKIRRLRMRRLSRF